MAEKTPEDAPRKKKKRKIDVLMDLVPHRDGFSCPFVGYFPSGFDPEQHNGSPGNGQSEQAGLKISGYQNTDRYKSRHFQLVVTPPDAAVDFVGTNYSGEGALWQPGNYALGVFDKESKTLKLVPIGGTKVLRMEPRVRGLDYGDSLAENTEIEASSREILLQKRNLLTSTFGTQKSRRLLSQYERGRVKEEALGDKEEIGRLFEKAGDNPSVLTSKEALEKANASIVRNIPPYDPSATTPDSVYVFDKIITLEEQNSLSDVASLKAAAVHVDKAGELLKQKTYPDFVMKRLHKLKIENDDKGNSKRAMILSYIRHLLSFYNLPRHLIKSIVDPVGYRGDLHRAKSVDLRSYSNIPNAVAVRILKLFTTMKQGVASGNDEVRFQTAENRNLLISYILVLGLMVDNFKADPYDLAVELKMTISRLKPFYMELGCKFNAVKKKERVGIEDPDSPQRTFEAVLNVPLEFPKMKAKTRRRR